LREPHRITSLVLINIRKGLVVILILIAINVIIALLEPTHFYLTLTHNITRSVFIIAMGVIAIQVIYTIEEVIYQQISGSRKETKRAKALYTKARILRNITTVLIILITIGALLMSFNSVRNLGVSILASAGFLTAIIGFAAQKPLGSFFSGLQIAITQPIKIGDLVFVQGQSGIIEELTFTYVAIKLGDKRRLIVPIHTFIETPFENWSRESDGLQNSIYLNVDYAIPITPLREHLTKILQSSTYWDGATNLLYISNLGEYSVQIRIQVSAAYPANLWNLMTEVREKMLAFLQENYADKLPRLSEQKT
jgi:small-conductance mechanosensitive channel